MRIGAQYSHLNGLEFLEARKPHIWTEIQEVIASVDAEACKTKVSKEKDMKGKLLYSPKCLNKRFRDAFYGRDWERPAQTRFFPTDDADLTRELMNLEPKEQKARLKALGKKIIGSYNEADFLKERVSLEVQFGKYSFVQFDMFIKHTANYMQNRIDLGVEIVPMKSMEEEMSSGPPFYEKHLHEILRQGRVFPPVPLILIGVLPDVHGLPTG